MVRVLLVAPSLELVGGHSMQADLLLRHFAGDSEVTMDLLPINPAIGPLRHVKYARTIITGAWYLLALLSRAWRYDVVHVFAAGYWAFLIAPVPAMLAGKLFRKRVILNYHDGRAPDHLANWRTAKLVRLAEEIIVPSAFLVEVFARYGIAARAIPNMIDAERFRYRERARPRPMFLHNRGLDPVYDPECTLRAFALVQARCPEAALTIAHDGPLRNSLEQLVREQGLQHVAFIGEVSNEKTPEVYDAADIFLSSPKWDNQPLSVLESFAAGLPVVSSNAGGVPDVVDDGRTGLLFPPGVHEAMARCIFRLLEEEGLALRLARAARVERERYSWASVGPLWRRVYMAR